MPVQASVHPKLIYFARRRPEMDAKAFRARWREHARLGMAMPRWRNIRRYTHCDAMGVSDSSLPADCYDGVAMIWYRDEARRLKHVTDDSAAAAMKQDELETFAHPVRDSALLADEYVFEPDRGAAGKLFVGFQRNDEIEPEAFRLWWLRKAGHVIRQQLLATKTVKGFVQNHCRLGDSKFSPPAVCACVAEIACEDMQSCESALVRAFDELPDFAAYVGDYKALRTIETVLHDVP